MDHKIILKVYLSSTGGTNKKIRYARRGRRRKQVLDNLKERRRYWKLKQGTLDCILWKTDLEEAMDLS